MTGSDVAAICDVDLKSIHNWVEHRGMPHFRTPGGHLRFKPRELAPYLREKGYDIPPSLVAAEAADLAKVVRAEAA